MYCSTCGKEVMDNAVICPGCGCMIKNNDTASANSSVTNKSDNKTQKSIILGIIGIVFAWLLAIVGHIVSIIGIITGIKEYKQTGKMTGLTLSIIGEVCSIFSSIVGAVAFSGIF